MRRTYAALLCLVWLLGIEVLPNVHLASHASRPHEHAADGTIITVSFDAHSHGDVVHSHASHPSRDSNASRDSRTSRARSRAGVLALEQAPDTHAASGLTHRAAALHASPPLILDAVPVDRVEHVARYARTGRDAVAPIATRDARGPPST